MSHAATYSYIDGTRRVSVHLELDGKIVVEVQTPDGQKKESYADEIDPQDSYRLISELFEIVPNLPDHPDGQLWVMLKDGDQEFPYRLSEYDVPFRGLDVGRIVRMIASDTIAGYQQRSPTRQGGPRDRKLNPLTFIGWAGAFAGFYVLAVIVGNVVLALGSFLGAYGFAIGWTLAGFIAAGSFYNVGQKFGEQFRGSFPAWVVAGVGTVPLIAAYWYIFGVGSIFVIPGMCAMPVFAQMGASTSY